MLAVPFAKALLVSSMLAMSTIGCATVPTGPTIAEASSVSESQALALAGRVADWQLAHMDDFTYIPASQFRDHAAAPRDWIQATFFLGLTAYADASGRSTYADAVLAHGTAETWGFDERPRHADADAIGAAWLWSAERTNDPSKLRPLVARFDAVLDAPSSVSLVFVKPERGDPECQTRWCWSDALFMAPPVWLELSRITGDDRYRAHADAEFWATTDYLYDKEEHLYFRDSRFFDQRGAEGRKIFWGRGNGWVFAALPRIIDSLPENHPSRARYQALFREMAARIVTLQGDQGYWPVSLLVPQATPETSGTGFFVYGLAWGVNNGLLDAQAYGPSIDRGWAALARAVSEDGRLGWVQKVGAAPADVGPQDTQLYGVGAFLLAASEVSRLEGSQR